MRYSELFGRTLREVPAGEESLNAQLLAKAGFVQKLMAGVYSFLPLGMRVLTKIENIVREEISDIGGQEVLMPSLHPKENWETTNRWTEMDVLFKLKSADNREAVLGPTHEEVVVPLAKTYINSYKDLPLYIYQIQTKFRDELRARSGLLRGREFRMKDLYSFHVDEKDLEEYYERSKEAYFKIFKRCGLSALLTEASGGTFSKYSHEFQVSARNGEDTIYKCSKCTYCQNKEIVPPTLSSLNPGDKGVCPSCGGELEVLRACEVGNIFMLKNKYSDPFKLSFLDRDGSQKSVMMGCYGIGTSRVMGVIAEVCNDTKGLRWPQEVAPLNVQLVMLGNTRDFAETVYIRIGGAGVEILYDERDETPGVKLADADLIGIPYRVVVSERTASQNMVEIKRRDSEEVRIVGVDEAIKIINASVPPRN